MSALRSVFVEDFDPNIDAAKWSTIQGELSVGTGPDGSNAWSVALGAGGSSTPQIIYTAPSSFRVARWVWRFDCLLEAPPSGRADHVLLGKLGAGYVAKTDVDPDGSVLFSANGHRHTTAAGVIANNTWQSWEIDVTLDTVDGAAKLVIDGTTHYDATGINTSDGVFNRTSFSVVTDAGRNEFDNCDLLIEVSGIQVGKVGVAQGAGIR